MYSSFTCISVYEPTAGRIVPATAQNRLGPLPTHFPSGRGRVRARGGRLQRRSASFPCGTSAIQAGAHAEARPGLSEVGSLTTISACHRSWALEVGIERTRRLEPAVVGCSVAAPLFAAAPLQSRQARRGKTRPFRRRIAHNHLHLPSELDVGGRNPAN